MNGLRTGAWAVAPTGRLLLVLIDRLDVEQGRGASGPTRTPTATVWVDGHWCHADQALWHNCSGDTSANLAYNGNDGKNLSLAAEW
jgi:hypothetical protein